MSEPQALRPGKNPAIMVFGVPGAGKTRLAGSGEATVIIRPPTDHTDSLDADADVKEIVVDSHNSFFETLADIQQKRLEAKWFWLDSISLMQDVLLDDVMADAIARREDRAVSKGGIKIPEFGPDQGEYKINFDRIAMWVRVMTGMAKAGQFSFGITAHPFEWFDPTADGGEGADVWAPWVQGKMMSPKICGYMNIVAYLQEQRSSEDDVEPQRVLYSDLPGHVGKDQYQCFPELKSGKHGLVDPTVPKLEAALRKARKGETPRRATKTRRVKRSRKGGKQSR